MACRGPYTLHGPKAVPEGKVFVGAATRHFQTFGVVHGVVKTPAGLVNFEQTHC
ncbi:ORFS360W [Human betaherpesvirus 5]|nr:ORFS360W [Human betaherpesvirus 5]QHX40730.1 ORFS360W [Human betaherpesvirus 5]